MIVSIKQTLRLALVAAIALPFAGCATLTADATKAGAAITRVVGGASKSLLAINQALAASAPSVSTLINGLEVADGYFQTIAATGVISKTAISLEQKSMAVVTAIANNPTTSVPAVANALAAALTNVQNLSAIGSTPKAVAIPATATTSAVPAA